MTQRYEHWIGGKPVPPARGRYLTSTRPVDGQEVAKIPAGDASDVATAVAAAAQAGPGWRARPPMERGRLLIALGAALRERAEEFIALESAETGKPDWQARLEVEGAAAYCEFYGGLVNIEQGHTLDAGPGTHAFTRREPYGVIGVITPWNSPLNQCVRSAAPALAMGNTVVVKPSEFTSAGSLTLARLVGEIGFPEGAFNVVTGTGEDAGAPLAGHPDVRRVSFTGSVRAGRLVGHIAADKIMPVTLELGGKAANIVFADADLDRAVEGSVLAFAYNTGQVCSAGTRLLVHESVHDRLVEQLVPRVREFGVRLGPLTTADQYEKVCRYFDIAKEDGATLATGGTGLGDNRVEPTVYTQVRGDMRIAREEIFGPVLSVLSFRSEDEAIRLANATDYGLSAGVWTRDISRALRVAERLEAGQVYVNAWRSSLIETPFGGYKQSGHGREKGLQALHEYTQLKSVIVTY
ncbi:aldehyde dehydrogenase family protein [Streptomyces sp. BH106]|uniref:aldehyde dehydrogenase family protein n=1 Tax=Streptomyces sp. BH106 TaxID=3410409 RepID=UPI003CF671E7